MLHYFKIIVLTRRRITFYDRLFKPIVAIDFTLCRHSSRNDTLHSTANITMHLKLFSREFLMPGLVDTHIHAPQYKNSGLGLGLPLLQWLEKYTFPCEARCKDLEFARNIYRKVVVS